MLFLLRLLLILSLVGLNAFFAAAEYALLSVRRTRLEQLAREGDRRARLAEGLLGDVGLLISGTQLGVTVVSVLMGWLGEGFIAAALQGVLQRHFGRLASAALAHSVSVLVALLLITALLMVLGELVPKAFAYAGAEQTSLFLARPLSVFLRLSREPVRGLHGIGNAVLRLLGHVPGTAHVAIHTPEEVKLIVSGIRKRGLLGREQEEMIRGVFDLHRVLIREIMVPRPGITCLPLTSDLDSLLTPILEDQHSRIPIYEGSPDRVIGILYTKDLLHILLERRRRGASIDEPFDLRSILYEPMIVPETMPLHQFLSEALRKHSHMALVVDEFGSFVGLVTIEDVLEEIVGDIRDEYDHEEKGISKLGESVLVVEGSLSLRDLAHDYDIALPRNGGYETLAGFVLARLGTIPKGNETFVFEGRRYTVLTVEGRRVAKVRVEKLTAGGLQSATAAGQKPAGA